MRSTYHEGEREAQRLAGTTEDADAMVPSLRAALSSGVCRYLEERTYAFIAAEDEDGRPWISLVEAERGLFSCVDEGRLGLRPDPREDDPVLRALRSPGRIAVLAIDLATRRRLRVNGWSQPAAGDGIIVTPAEVFGNCPKYIAQRKIVGSTTRRPRTWDVWAIEDCAEIVLAADCMAIATAHPSGGLDASHRGGQPGFLRLRGQDTIEWDDYAGNGMFQSNGNLLVDPRAAIALPVFETGDLLLMTGHATTTWSSPRTTTFRRSAALRIEGAIGSLFSPPEPSPFSPSEGSIDP